MSQILEDMGTVFESRRNNDHEKFCAEIAAGSMVHCVNLGSIVIDQDLVDSAMYVSILTERIARQIELSPAKRNGLVKHRDQEITWRISETRGLTPILKLQTVTQKKPGFLKRICFHFGAA